MSVTDAMSQTRPYYTIRTRGPTDGSSLNSEDSTYGSQTSDAGPPATTHDTSRVQYHVKHLDSFAQSLQDSAARAFPNKGRGSNRYQKVQALLLHWRSDDLFVLPELEDLEKCLREDYLFDTEIFAIPSDNPHLELMLKLAALVKQYEDEDTLFVIYYGGHAKIDESRQSLWCATRNSSSPSLQWNAVQTLLERSKSDVLILLDCCAGAASATFPNGKSITETISASSWDSIAPDPGRYSFTNALIEVMGEWRNRVFSAAMLHTEVLARLKHPRPIQINGKHFEARSTPVHFMMTSNHKAPSIEIGRIVPDSVRPPSPPREPTPAEEMGGRGPSASEGCYTEPTEDQPHVMISLALEDNQRLDLNAWENWLASFPALAKYVKVQGVFKSHSTLLLLSLPITVWDMLPDDRACNFIAYIRSNNMALPSGPRTEHVQPVEEQTGDVVRDRRDSDSLLSGTTYAHTDNTSITMVDSLNEQARAFHRARSMHGNERQDAMLRLPVRSNTAAASLRTGMLRSHVGAAGDAERPGTSAARSTASSHFGQVPLRAATFGAPRSMRSMGDSISRQPLANQARSGKQSYVDDTRELPQRPPLAEHVTARLEDYFERDPRPSLGDTEYYASHLGIETADVNLWFHNRRQHQQAISNLQNLKLDNRPKDQGQGPSMILSGQLHDLLDMSEPGQVLCVDLRPLAAYRKSHVQGAVNLRVPLKLLEVANAEMLQRTFEDEQSRRLFTNWRRSRCLVVYDRSIDTLADCPTADALFDVLRREGWAGRCFVLKGPFREFSLSFEPFLASDNMSQEAKDVQSGRRAAASSPDESRQRQVRYEQWLEHVTANGLRSTPSTAFDPVREAERKAAGETQQKELEVDFHHRFPDLAKKISQEAAAREDGTFDARKGKFVAPLSAGLDKMRSAVGSADDTRPSPFRSGSSFPARTDDKLAELAREADEFEEVDLRLRQLDRASSMDERTALEDRPATTSPIELGRAKGGNDKTNLFQRFR